MISPSLYMDLTLALNFKMKTKKIIKCIGFILITLSILFVMENIAYAQILKTPLEIINEREIQNKDSKGEVFLGCVLTIQYPAYKIEPSERYYPLLLELADILNTPIRGNYRIELTGYTDSSGTKEQNMVLSRKRVDVLKRILVEVFHISPDRISTRAMGDANPIASNDTAEGRAKNRRVEIGVYGDVSEAVKFLKD